MFVNQTVQGSCSVSICETVINFLPLQGCFVFATIWSIGGTCDGDSRTIFDNFLRETLSGKSEANPIPENLGTWECPLGEKGLVYDYVYEVGVASASIKQILRVLIEGKCSRVGILTL